MCPVTQTLAVHEDVDVLSQIALLVEDVIPDLRLEAEYFLQCRAYGCSGDGTFGAVNVALEI